MRYKFVAGFTAILLLFLITGCGSLDIQAKQTSAPTESPAPTQNETPTPIPTPTATPEPEGELGYARADGTGLIYALLNRGDIIEVIDQQGDYYIVTMDGQKLFVEKRLISMLSSGEYESWKGYARSNTPVYADFHMFGDPVQNLRTNQTFTVLADLGNGYLVLFDDESTGFIPTKKVSKSRVSEGGDNGGGDGGGGGGGGSSDGGDIVLGAFNLEYSIIRLATATEPTEEFLPGKATVLVDNTEAYILFLNRDETVKVIDTEENCYLVLHDGMTLSVTKLLLRLESETPYEAWDGFARSQAPMYATIWQSGDATKLKQNAKLVVLDDFGFNYLVKTEDGVLGFVATKQVSKNRFQAESGGGDGGSGGGGGGGGEWTEPVL